MLDNRIFTVLPIKFNLNISFCVMGFFGESFQSGFDVVGKFNFKNLMFSVESDCV